LFTIAFAAVDDDPGSFVMVVVVIPMEGVDEPVVSAWLCYCYFLFVVQIRNQERQQQQQ